MKHQINRGASGETPDGIYVKETRRNIYVQRNGENKPRPFANKSFKPIPKESLDDIYKLSLRRVLVNDKRLRTINLEKKPQPYVKMPALRELISVKTEKEHFGLSESELGSVDRAARDNPEHRDLLRSYMRGRPTKSIAPEEFQFIDGILTGGLTLLLAKRVQAASTSVENANSTASTNGSIRMSISSKTSLLRNDTGRNSKAKKSSRGSKSMSIDEASSLSSGKKQKTGSSGVRKRKVFSSTAAVSNNLSGFESVRLKKTFHRLR